jgi:hypothetical protein
MSSVTSLASFGNGTAVLPPGSNQLCGQLVRVMNEGRKTLRADMDFTSGEAENNHREIFFGTAAAQACDGLLFGHGLYFC